MKPSSQLKIMTFGKVVSLPNRDPFCGTDRFPQSFATARERKKEIKLLPHVYKKTWVPESDNVNIKKNHTPFTTTKYLLRIKENICRKGLRHPECS